MDGRGRKPGEENQVNENKSDMNAQSLTLRIDSDTTTRKGVFADVSIVSSNGAIARIDFISGDLPSEESVGAVLSSRVYMTVSSLLELREQIDRQIGTSEGADVDRA